MLHKKSTYQIQAEEYQDPTFLRLLEEGNEVVEKVKRAHKEHVETIEVVHEALSSRKIDFRSIARADLEQKITDIDLMISVGGDGTFLDASHYLADIPILGVNSSRSSSFGHFCMAQADNIESVLDKILEGSLEPLDILRLNLSLNGSNLGEKVLNEVLICHDNPAATSRYLIEVDGHKEEHRSSGILVGTPAGSTGTLRSSGGQVQAIDDKCFQFRVREPGMRPGESWRNREGLLEKDRRIIITSQMRTGALYIDGPHIIYPFCLGDSLEISADRADLLAFVDARVNDMFTAMPATEQRG